MSKPVVLTGLRANNDLHIGNYFGALLPMVDMAKDKAGEYQINLFVPDLHSFTTPIDHRKLQENIMHSLKLFAAAGLPLDNPSVHIYRQSYIPAHSELAWIFNCFTGFGELSRMTEFKDKSAKLGAERIGVGQFDYPPLMAADILLYNAIYVPVGDDQRQHIEYTRTIAERLNRKFNEELFVIPKSMKEQHEFFARDQGIRIRDLQDPAKKMSKSDDSGRGIIFLTDSPESARKKIMSSTTDSLTQVEHPDFESRPGVANLVQILNLLKPGAGHAVSHLNYKEFKEIVADELVQFLTDFQTRLSLVNEKEILAKLEASEMAMNQQANKTLLKVQKAVGLR